MGDPTAAILKECKTRISNLKRVKGSVPTYFLSKEDLMTPLELPTNLPPGSCSLLFDICLVTAGPSEIPLHELEHITIPDLLIETQHTGKVIVVRLIHSPGTAYGNLFVAEDTNGRVLPLMIYDWEVQGSSRWNIPLKVAIKEPYLSQDINGMPTLKVNHICDVIPIEELLIRSRNNDPGPSPENLNQMLAEVLKEKGNESYRAKGYHRALWFYSRSMELSTSTVAGGRKLLLRNRAATNILLGRNEAACTDALASLLNESDGLDKDTMVAKNTQALVRAGKACYALTDYRQASNHLEAASALSPADVLIRKEQLRVGERMKEVQTGAYDFDKMHDDWTSGRARCDYASFTSNVRVGWTDSRGRGLFAAQDLKAGELILVEKAFEIGQKPPSDASVRSLAIAATQRIYPEAQVELAAALSRKIRYNTCYGKDFFKLYDGSTNSELNLQKVDGNLVVDEFKVLAIASYNSFAISKERKFDAVALPTISDLTAGLWIVASAINHECAGNAMRSFRGDMMILRATKDIAAGDEITMPYIVHYNNHAKLVIDMQTSWGFKCSCAICEAEDQVSYSQQRSRSDLHERATRILLAQRECRTLNQTLKKKMLALLRSFEATYNASTFGNLPRIGLARFLFLVGHFFYGAKQYEDCIKHGLDCLKHMGFDITVDNTHAKIDRQRSALCEMPIIAMLDMAKSYDALGKVSLAQDFTEMARISHIAFYGDEHDFAASRRPNANFIWAGSE